MDFKTWNIAKILYCITVSVVILETAAKAHAEQFLFVEVVVDSKNCMNNDTRWQTQQEIVFEVLKRHKELDLSFSGKYCGCLFSTKNVCKSEYNKSVEMLMYESNTGSINADATSILDLEKELEVVPPEILAGLKATLQPFYDCSNLEIITDVDPKYKSCMSRPKYNFTNVDSSKSEVGSGPNTGTIIGAAFGGFAALGIIAALAWFVLRHLKKNEIGDDGSSSDISPIVNGVPDFGNATNSVAPAGTC